MIPGRCMRQLGINRRYRRPPAFADILQVDEVQQAVFEAHAAYEDSEEASDMNFSATRGGKKKWKQIKKRAYQVIFQMGQRNRALARFEQLSEFDLQGLVFAQDDIGPYFR